MNKKNKLQISKIIYTDPNDTLTAKALQLEKIMGVIDNEDSKYLEALKFLRSMIDKNCCHTLLDPDYVEEKLDKILNN